MWTFRKVSHIFLHFILLLLEIAFFPDWWSHTEITVYCKKKDFVYLGNEHCFIIPNHSYEFDWVVILQMIEKLGGIGNTRIFAKKSIKNFPMIGWVIQLSEYPLLHRSFEKDQKVIEESIQKYLTHMRSSWIWMNPEGTRFTKARYDESVKFCNERKIQPFKHHLFPRSKGFCLSIPILKKFKCPALYNVQLAFENNAEVQPSIKNLLMGKTFKVHIYIERIPIDEVEPTFEFLCDFYKKKDALHEHFLQNGNFKQVEGLTSDDVFKLERSLPVLIHQMCWVLVELGVVAFFAAKLILSGQYFLLTSLSVGIITVCKY